MSPTWSFGVVVVVTILGSLIGMFLFTIELTKKVTF